MLFITSSDFLFWEVGLLPSAGLFMAVGSLRANILCFGLTPFQSIGGGWIEAQNSRGEVGLVPEDYIEVRNGLLVSAIDENVNLPLSKVVPFQPVKTSIC